MRSFKNAIKNVEQDIEQLKQQLEYYDLRIAQAIKYNNHQLVDNLVAKQKACEVQLCSARSQLDNICVKQSEEKRRNIRSAM